MQSETLDEALADLYDVARPGTPAAAHFRATAETVAQPPDLSGLDDAWDLLNHVPEIGDMPASTEHDDDCWKRHASCLTDRLAKILPELS